MGMGERCAGCGKAIGMQWITAEGGVWHEQCLTCDLCRSPLSRRYSTSPPWKWRVCDRHGLLMNCDCCGRAIPGTYNDPAVLDRCEICRREAVERDSDARDRFRESVDWLRKQGLNAGGRMPLRLDLVDANWMHAASGRSSSGQLMGIARHTVMAHPDGRRTASHDGIVVLRGLPDPYFQSVVVHELGHAWVVAKGLVDMPDQAQEGFCQALAYRYLQRSSHRAASGFAQLIAQNTDPVYGDGFRAVQALVEQVGFDRVISSLADDGRFPTGKSRRWGR